MATSHDLKAFKLNIASGSKQGDISWTLSSNTTIVAIHVLPVSPVIGDKVKVQMLAGAYVVKEFGVDTYITENPVDMDFDRQDPLDIPAGITLKLVYDAVDTNGRDFIMWVRYRQ